MVEVIAKWLLEDAWTLLYSHKNPNNKKQKKKPKQNKT